MVLDTIVVIDDFYCNIDGVAANAIGQLNGISRTAGGNMHAIGIQRSLQRHLAYKIKDFKDCVDKHGNGCFSSTLSNLPNATDWIGVLLLGITGEHNSNNDQIVLTIGSTGTMVDLPINRLVLFRRDKVSFSNKGASLLDKTRLPVFQLFFFNTHNSDFLQTDHDVIIKRLKTFKVIPGLLSQEKCKAYIAAAEEWAQVNNGGSWMTKRHNQYPTTDIPTKSLYFNDELTDLVKDCLFPLLEEYFLFPQDTFSLEDFFIVKYDAKAQNKLNWHRDVSMLSFNFALNADFDGGGTSFHTLDKVVKIGTGDLLMHSGKALHAGQATTEGIRYIIVGFVNVKSPRINWAHIDRVTKFGMADEDVFQDILLF